jgi:EAL domain-containing protein (putative c-di-GMP-specific phosphodiesterase class I)
LGAVAEGVETLDHLRTVTLAGCDVQGFYFSKPVPASQVQAVLKSVPERLAPIDSCLRKSRTESALRRR